MNNDLISREALKKALKEYKYCGFYDKVIEIIDNAPTVDIKDQIAGAYNEGFMCGNKEAENARTQGKWYRTQGKWYRTGQSFIDPNKFRNYGCSVCRYELDEHIREEPNFCPNCGAKMKGGADNEHL